MVVGLLLLVVGCSSMRVSSKDYPIHTYEQPMDLVYLKTYEALSKYDEWVPNLTDKTNGINEVRNIKYANLLDFDTQLARFVIKMVSRTETSVELDTERSRCKGNGCLELLDSINATLSRLPAKPKPQTQPNP